MNLVDKCENLTIIKRCKRLAMAWTETEQCLPIERLRSNSRVHHNHSLWLWETPIHFYTCHPGTLKRTTICAIFDHMSNPKHCCGHTFNSHGDRETGSNNTDINCEMKIKRQSDCEYTLLGIKNLKLQHGSTEYNKMYFCEQPPTNNWLISM